MVQHSNVYTNVRHSPSSPLRLYGCHHAFKQSFYPGDPTWIWSLLTSQTCTPSNALPFTRSTVCTSVLMLSALSDTMYALPCKRVQLASLHLTTLLTRNLNPMHPTSGAALATLLQITSGASQVTVLRCDCTSQRRCVSTALLHIETRNVETCTACSFAHFQLFCQCVLPKIASIS